ncbi:MAG: arginine deiminase [Oscillospiraceae bacterium]|nr:arginine deiminase [Oscillospiraceae bacterium]
MPISVKSETGPLRRVLLHRPGRELEYLVPTDLERLLFDDIPYLTAARREHDTFAGLLRAEGAEVVYLEELMAETLTAVPGLREQFVRDFIAQGGGVAQRYAAELYELLCAESSDLALVVRTMTGVGVGELPDPARKSPLAQLSGSRSYTLDPLPNLYFTRDPFACIGDGVSVHAMYSPARRRETVYGDYIMRYHPDYAGRVRRWFDRNCPFSLEGGDVFNLSEKVLALGISQRTAPEAVELLAANLFADESCSVRQILAMEIPRIRAYMHLDTVFTQVDRDKFTVHPGALESMRLFSVTPGERGRLRVTERTEPLDRVLSELLGLDKVTLIRCGGRDAIASEREQWNDGANALCVAPGRVIVYDRNQVTNQALRDNGLEVIEMSSSELSRGRGGPRCMTMPLLRIS